MNKDGTSEIFSFHNFRIRIFESKENIRERSRPYIATVFSFSLFSRLVLRRLKRVNSFSKTVRYFHLFSGCPSKNPPFRFPRPFLPLTCPRFFWETNDTGQKVSFESSKFPGVTVNSV